MMKQLPPDTLHSFAFLNFAGIEIIGHSSDDTVIARIHRGKKKKTCIFRESDIAAASTSMLWLYEHPRLEQIEGFMRTIHRSAIDTRMRDETLETWLTADNYFSGFIFTQQMQCMDSLTAILFPGSDLHEDAVKGAAFYWFYALKIYLSERFPEFLRPDGGGDEMFGNAISKGEQVQRAMNATIRALTKGDITIERRVLESNLWRALTELNELAREAREFEEKYNKKN